MTSCPSSPARKQKPASVYFTPRNTLANRSTSPAKGIADPLTSFESPNNTSLFESVVEELGTSPAIVRERETPSKSSQSKSKAATMSDEPENYYRPPVDLAARLKALSNSQDAQQSQQHKAPEFGKASPLRSAFNKIESKVFNIPNRGASRAEHHKGPPSRQTSGTYNPPAFQIPPTIEFDANGRIIPRARPAGPVASTSGVMPGQSGSSATQPSYYVRPNEFQPSFSSMAYGSGAGSGSFQPVNSRSKPEVGDDGEVFDPDAGLRDNRFGAPDPLDYVDPTQVNANMKALLEGAFNEDDLNEDGTNRRRLPRRVKKVVEKVEEARKTLADKLKSHDESQKEEAEHEDDEDDEDDGTVDGLKVKLLPHQINGVAWMLAKENGATKVKGVVPRGGILADDMGLGKTIQALGLMLTNPRPANSEIEKERSKTKKIPIECSKSTLVVAPLALIRQWESEIKLKSEGLSVCVHHGSSRTSSGDKLKKHDVVITTYQTLTSEHASSPEDGPGTGCFGVHWYRVILDEAHSIKNRNAKSTKACYKLKSVYRWCLTGTPMQNHLDELQSLIHFLRVKPYCDLSVWKAQISNPMKSNRGAVAMRRLQFFLKALLLRRTKDVLKKEGALTNGKNGHSANFKIVDRNVQTIVAEFSDHERNFYDKLESRAEESLEQMTGQSNQYIHALVVLLRLRQSCNHPQLMRMRALKDKEILTVAPIDRGTRQAKANGDDVDSLTAMLGGLDVKDRKCDMCQMKLSNEEMGNDSAHCQECEDNIAEEERREAKQHKKKSKTKSRSKKMSAGDRMKIRAERNRRAIIDSDDEAENEWIVKRKDRTELAEGGVDTDEEDEDGHGDWIGKDDSETGDEDEDEEDSEDDSDSGDSVVEFPLLNVKMNRQFGEIGPLRPSTKINHLLDILEKETPDHKVIVFSEFTSMLDLIELFLAEEDYGYVRYDGSMRNDDREASLNKLRTNASTRILLCSLKCGSLGLNLTAASRVVLMEPFWNPFVEEQAIDRVHRLNQTQDVTIYRLTVANTVEERIVQLQESKRKLAAAALDGGKGFAKLSMQDILALFKHDYEDRTGVEAVSIHTSKAPKMWTSVQSSAPVAASSSSMARERIPNRDFSGRRQEDPVWGRR
jgi:SNF2 family DNA or RNA helicase